MANGRIKILERAFFQLLVFLLPTQLGLHFWPEWAFVYGIRVDYFSPTIYITDIVLALLLFIYLLNGRKTKKLISRRALLILGAVTTLSFLNIVSSQNWQVAFLKWLKIFEASTLTLYIIFSKSMNFRKLVKTPLIFGVIMISLIAIAQVSLQRTIGGPFYLMGERSFSASTPGIALVSFFGSETMRAYSIFSHPNSFAGFLSVSLLLLWSLSSKKKRRLLVPTILGVLALVFSFSRGAFLSLFLILVITTIAKRGLLNFKKMTKALLVTSISISILFPILSRGALMKSSLSESVAMRIKLSDVAGKLIAKSPLVGVGLNNFIVHSPAEMARESFSWSLQPVHNIFLLVFAELGLVGVLMLMFLFWKALENRKYALPFLFVLVSGAFDHYWLTLQQNVLLLALLFGLSFRKA